MNTYFRDSHNPTIRNSKPGIYAECLDPRCRICSLGYIKECSSFVTANNISWEIKGHNNCNSKNVIYFLNYYYYYYYYLIIYKAPKFTNENVQGRILYIHYSPISLLEKVRLQFPFENFNRFG